MLKDSSLNIKICSRSVCVCVSTTMWQLCNLATLDYVYAATPGINLYMYRFFGSSHSLDIFGICDNFSYANSRPDKQQKKHILAATWNIRCSTQICCVFCWNVYGFVFPKLLFMTHSRARTWVVGSCLESCWAPAVRPLFGRATQSSWKIYSIW